MTTITPTPLPPETEMPGPPPPVPPKRRFFSWRSDRPRWQVVALFGAALLVGVGIGAPAGNGEDLSKDVARLDRANDSLMERNADLRDQVNEDQGLLDEADAALAAGQDEYDARKAELDGREAALDEREAGLDTREGQITSAEAAAEANSFGNGVHVVGTDIQPGTYKSDGPDSGSGGMGYWARLSGTGGTLDEIIANDLPSGPVTVTISASDAAFESTGMQTWTKVG